jgi:hypothetical protein
MRPQMYEILGVTFFLGSGFFFYRTVEFLAQADYVAGFMALVVAFLVVRAGVDISRLAVALEREQ